MTAIGGAVAVGGRSSLDGFPFSEAGRLEKVVGTLLTTESSCVGMFAGCKGVLGRISLLLLWIAAIERPLPSIYEGSPRSVRAARLAPVRR